MAFKSNQFQILNMKSNGKAGKSVKRFGEVVTYTGVKVLMATSKGPMWWDEFKDKQGNILYG